MRHSQPSLNIQTNPLSLSTHLSERALLSREGWGTKIHYIYKSFQKGRYPHAQKFFFKILRVFHYKVFPPIFINTHTMREDTGRTYSAMYSYLKETVDNLHTVIELYSSDPEEALRQSRILLTSAKSRANEFEETHCQGDLNKTPAKSGSKAYKLNMKKQLFGNKPDDQLLT